MAVNQSLPHGAGVFSKTFPPLRILLTLSKIMRQIVYELALILENAVFNNVDYFVVCGGVMARITAFWRGLACVGTHNL